MDSPMNTSSTNQSASNDALSTDSDGFQRDFVTPNEFVKLSGLSLSSVWRYLADGRLPKVQPGGHRGKVLIPRDALKMLLRASEASELAAPSNESGKPEATSAIEPTSRAQSGSRPHWQKRSNK